MIEEPTWTTFHDAEQYANDRIEADDGRLKVRLRPMLGLKRAHTTRVIIRGHALVPDIRRGHYELGIESQIAESRPLYGFIGTAIAGVIVITTGWRRADPIARPDTGPVTTVGAPSRRRPSCDMTRTTGPCCESISTWATSRTVAAGRVAELRHFRA